MKTSQKMDRRRTKFIHEPTARGPHKTNVQKRTPFVFVFAHTGGDLRCEEIFETNWCVLSVDTHYYTAISLLQCLAQLRAHLWRIMHLDDDYPGDQGFPEKYRCNPGHNDRLVRAACLPTCAERGASNIPISLSF